MDFRFNGYSSSSQVTNFIPFFSEVRSSFSTAGFQSNLLMDPTTCVPIPSTCLSTLVGALKTCAGLPRAWVRRLKRTLPTPGAIVKASQ